MVHTPAHKQPHKLPYEIVYGIHPLIELLRAKHRTVYQVYTTDPKPKAFDQIKPLLPARIPVTIVKREVLTRMAETSEHQGIVATVAPFPFRKKLFDPAREPFLVMTESIQDTRNVGGIIRSAYCTNASGVVITSKESAPVNASTCKASAGLIEHLQVYQSNAALKTALELKNQGYNLYLAALGGTSATAINFILPCCIVIGNEASGISPQLLKLGTTVMLPQKQADISYNASVAAGILLFTVATQHHLI
jgi:23S rRNA (guanosine2251-2'-O)-methyltransferase